VRSGITAALSVKVVEPIFESQTKTKLGSTEIEPNGASLRSFILDFLKRELDNFLHKNPEVADAIQRRIHAKRKGTKGPRWN